VHIHIKDATWNAGKNDADYNWPGEGQGRVRDIVKDALARGYDAALSIEPHMVVVFHEAQSKATSDEVMRKNYVEYGRRVEKLVQALRQELAASK
jgi:sugar phosphate isomerase/epimerase